MQNNAQEQQDPIPAPIPSNSNEKKAHFKAIADHCAKYKTPTLRESITQATLSLCLFFGACSLLFYTITHGLWLGYAALIIPTAGFLVRLFIIQHDCGHGSFFKNSMANTILGRLISVFTWTPYHYWARMHNIHHAGSGNLDRRGYGGIETFTIEEYKALSEPMKKKYRLYRNPLLLLGLATPFFMIFGQRVSLFIQPIILPEGSKKMEFTGGKIIKSIYGTNIALLATYGLLGYFIGYGTLAALYLPVLITTCWMGGWLFYIQHQFEETHWDKSAEWSYNEAAIMGSSYYALPKPLQWMTGNIGIHHVHHLNASIPNYRLQQCIDDMPSLKYINRMTFKDSLPCIKWALWDQENRKMIGFKDLEKA
jgi:omega-6 fatty acid desaturase (delta-12 desaturase)